MGELSAVVLAAGSGKRMKSELPKALHEVCGVPMLAYVLELARAASAARILAVVGYGAEAVEGRFRCPDVSWVVQEKRLGTGHAVRQAIPFVGRETSDVLVLQADMPLIRKRTVRELVKSHADGGRVASILVCRRPEPGSMGRVVRDEKGRVMAIREHADAGAEERDIDEVNVGCYCFEVGALRGGLEKVGKENKQGEYYLTDVVEELYRSGEEVVGVEVEDWREAFGVSTQEDVEKASELMREMAAERSRAAGGDK